jgi:hypothetical protein
LEGNGFESQEKRSLNCLQLKTYYLHIILLKDCEVKIKFELALKKSPTPRTSRSPRRPGPFEAREGAARSPIHTHLTETSSTPNVALI